ncbi:glycosyltransferase [Desulfonauticus submarinus]
MVSDPKVSIIIPTYNEEEDIEKTLQACVGLDYQNKEIIVVDDSTDKTPKIVRKFESQGVKLIHRDENKGGRCGARNVGIKEAKGEILIILNADVLLPKDFIKKILPHYQNGAGLVLVESEVINREDLFARFVDAEEKYTHKGSWDWVYWTEGFSCLKKAALDAGLFPEPSLTIPAGEDGYFGKKIIERGYKKVIDYSIIVGHIASPKLKDFWRIRKERASAFSAYFLEKRSILNIFLRYIISTSLFFLKSVLIFPMIYKGYRFSKFSPRGNRDAIPFAYAYFLQELAFTSGKWSSFFKLLKWKISNS